MRFFLSHRKRNDLRGAQSKADEQELRALVGARLARLGAVVSPPPSLRPTQVERLAATDPDGMAKNSGRREKGRAPILRYGVALAAVLCIAVVTGAVLPVLRAYSPGAASSHTQQVPSIAANTVSGTSSVAGDGTVTTKKNYDSLLSLFQKMVENGLVSQNVRMMAKGAIAYGTNATAAPEATTELSDAAGGDYSSTNLQVAGVDEGDTVKNDGSYLYVVADDTVRVADIRTPGKMKLVSTLRFNGQETPAELFVRGNRLVVVLKGYRQSSTSSASDETSAAATAPAAGETAAGGGTAVQGKTAAVQGGLVDYAYNLGTSVTLVKVYDISDRSAPKLTRDFSQDGYEISVRLVGTSLYVASDYAVYPRDKNITVADVVPEAGSAGSPAILAPDQLFLPAAPQTASWIVLSGLDIQNSAARASSAACLGSSDNSVYCSAGNFYVSCQNLRYTVKKDSSGTAYAEFDDSGAKTELLRFSIRAGAVSFTGSCSVNGRVENQFCLDETGDYLRVATQKQDADGETSSGVYVLDSSLHQIGALENIAPGENLHGVRFMGSRAYLVTFRTVDPLFALDLSKPAAPKVLGNLKTPGFSDYIQPWSDTLLLGFGQDTAELSNGNVRTNGLKISLYDVSDPMNPRELFQYKMGGYGSSSPVLSDHRALLLSKEKNLIAIPVELVDYGAVAGSNGTVSNAFQFQGLYVLGLDMKKGFFLRGKTTQMKDGANQSDLYANNLYVSRGAWAADTLFSISGSRIDSVSLSDFKNLDSLWFQ